jgi:hypothetical protein
VDPGPSVRHPRHVLPQEKPENGLLFSNEKTGPRNRGPESVFCEIEIGVGVLDCTLWVRQENQGQFWLIESEGGDIAAFTLGNAASYSSGDR